MSHQIHGERSGLINKEWDTAFLNDLTANPARLVNLTHVDYIRDAGAEGIELIVWLIMRGALQDNAKETFRHYHVPASNTAAGLIVLENR
jgi:protocatechuate 4,5-dioxygenase beta chain